MMYFCFLLDMLWQCTMMPMNSKDIRFISNVNMLFKLIARVFSLRCLVYHYVMGNFESGNIRRDKDPYRSTNPFEERYSEEDDEDKQNHIVSR